MDTEAIVIAAGVSTAFLAVLFGAYNIAGGFRGIYESCCVNKISPEDDDELDDDDDDQGGGESACLHLARHPSISCVRFSRCFFYKKTLLTHIPPLPPHAHVNTRRRRRRRRRRQMWRKG